MSLAEVASFDDRGPGLDRTPPQDIAAEQSVLGAMLTSKDAIADVVEIIKGRDFYRPAHEQIYEAIIELYGKGEPADAITVAAELAKRGEIGRVGGHVYLHDLLASISVAANAGYYAEIVKEKAVLRRLVEASVKIAQMGYQAQGDVGDIVDSAQQALYEVTEGKTSEDYQPLSSLLESTLDEIEAIGSRGGQMAGVPTGFIELDELTNGLHSGQMIIVAARPAMGKALALDTALPTPTGWTTMGDVQVGDQLIGADGRPTRVVAATDVMTDRPCYRITFSDGTQVVADAEHQWRATSRAGRRAEAERKAPRTYLPSPSVQRLQALADAADGASTMATYRELLEEVGTVFQHVLHVVLRDVGSQGRALRPASGESRSYAWHAPVYDRARALRALADRCAAPVGSRVRVAHSPIVTTEQMAETVTLADGRANWAVELASPVELPERQLLVPPYTLGVWLGDGHSRSARFTSADSQIADEVRADGLVVTARGLLHTMQLSRTPVEVRKCVVCGSGFVPRQADVRTCGRVCGGKSRGILKPAPSACPDCGKPYSGGQQCARCRAAVGSVQARLRTLGVLGNKHIPSAYLRASRTQRWALLEGLMDTDGTVTRTGSLQLVLTDAALARDASELIMSLGIRCQTATKKVRGRDEAHSIAYVLTFSADDSPFRLTRKREAHAARRGHGRTTGRRYIKSIEPIQSVPVRCVEVDNADHMYLATEAMVPTHNSTLGLDFARAASIKNGLCSAFFSLEMSKSEIVMRLLSAEAQIPLNHIRKGQMTDEDWARMSRKMGQISEAPLYIDDSPNLTMMEIRAKARRLKQRHDLKLVIIDYMQLMTSGKRVESRQLEVSEFSRQIKLLAKELELPVVALSQLNRGPEQRQGGTPMLSDLRESGCLTADTRLLRADTGEEETLGSLLERDARDVPVWSMDAHHRLVPATLTHAFPSGRKPVFRMRLASGREIKATANHKFYTLDGWLPLGELTVGTRLATPRAISEPQCTAAWDEDEIVLLAHMLGDGSMLKRQPLRYASVDEANLTAVSEAAQRRFGITGVRDEYAAARVTSLRLRSPFRLTHGRRNPMAAWLDSIGVFDKRSHEKFVPAGVFGLPRQQVALFLRHLWATDGSVRWDATAGQGRIYYATSSRRLADDVARLLLRFGIVARIKTARKSGYRDNYHVCVYGADHQTTFCEQIGVHGSRGVKAAEVLQHLGAITAKTNLDTVPVGVWNRVREDLVELGMSHRSFAAAMQTQFCGSTMWRHAPSRQRLARVATLLDDPTLEELATSDLSWDSIVAIEPLGEQDVYDATVLGTHNFIADGIIAHNSLEQDADMVILLHRDDVYNRDSARQGEADFIVAKHRNGPTKTLTTAFQGHYSRFVDMQH